MKAGNRLEEKTWMSMRPKFFLRQVARKKSGVVYPALTPKEERQRQRGRASSKTVSVREWRS
ncbi:hypothetical protein AMQ83_01895 [Paenibacillus riograndensis]|nr:hypothetical protein AMQ83_01895 [Paenibacillus riograndensis]